MAQWKKVIVSGSSAELSQLTLDTQLAVTSGGTGVTALSDITAGSGLTVTNGTDTVIGGDVTISLDGNVSDISGITPTDGTFIVGDGANFVGETGDTARTSLGLGTGDNVTFTQITGSAIQLTSLPTGTDNTVLVIDGSGNVVTDEIDSRVWGSTLVDGSGTTNQVAYWSDSDTLTGNAGFTFDGSTLTAPDVTVTGDLTILGDTVTANVSTITVEDKFILLNSGSVSGLNDGGIIIETGTGGQGVAFGWDNSATRFGFQQVTELSAAGTEIATEAFVASVLDIDAGLSDIAAFQKNGNIKVDSGEIYIYA